MEKEKEVWVDIENYNGVYQISNIGNVRSLYYNRRLTTKYTLLKQRVNPDGYMCVGLTLNKKQKKQRVHRLVAMGFIDNPENKSEVNHKDGVKKNNTVGNLEWNTHRENMVHATINGLIDKEKQKKAVIITGKKNGKLVLNLETGIFYPSCKEAAMAHGLPYTRLTDYLIGRSPNKTMLIYA